ncbi:unnamed protein product [Phytophthora lilii]|uniref:Unnamed protein product n=1 Tax=Phytophthora lilii TaxID=2077276 RepID=A0A9W6TDI0_9STRA|nr:unnamed protein product [Phytophthora lilii]
MPEVAFSAAVAPVRTSSPPGTSRWLAKYVAVDSQTAPSIISITATKSINTLLHPPRKADSRFLACMSPKLTSESTSRMLPPAQPPAVHTTVFTLPQLHTTSEHKLPYNRSSNLKL